MLSTMHRRILTSWFLLICSPVCKLASGVADTADASRAKRAEKTFRVDSGEMRDAALIFDDVWMHLVQSFGGETVLSFPQEIIWLNGAPGAGKTTNTKFIREERSIVAEPLVVSSLLSHPSYKALKDKGFLVGDKVVTQMLFEELLEPKYHAGVVVDGYPRTDVQATICRMLHDRLLGLHRSYRGNLLRPVWRIVVLYVDEETAVARQLRRRLEVEAHNAKVQNTGQGELLESRPTDKDEALATRRYKIFIEKTYTALQALGKHFIYNLIDAMPPVEQVRRNIAEEMQYQSSIELNPETFNMILDLELASEVIMNARQRLVRRMDDYALRMPEKFAEVINLLKVDVYPIIHQHAVSGRCSYVCHNPLLTDGLAIQIAIDVLSERGFRVTSEPVVRGAKFDIMWTPPDKLGSTRLDSRGRETRNALRIPVALQESLDAALSADTGLKFGASEDVVMKRRSEL